MRLFCIFLLLMFSSCGDETKREEKSALDYKLNPKVKILVDSLSLIKYISYGDKQTKRYDSLVANTSYNDLVFLTNHKNPYIRCFSFLALTKKDYPKIKNIFSEHKNDTAKVVTGMYDMTGNETVANYMLQQLHPNSQSKYKFTKKEFKELYDFVSMRDKKLKPITEKKINWQDSIEKRQHIDLEYTQEFYCGDSSDKDFATKRRLIKKKVPFQKFDDNILVTAYFEVNGCHAHFPNIERKGDTIVLKDQILYKNPCDENFRVIHKINFLIFNQYITKIKTVIVE